MAKKNRIFMSEVGFKIQEVDDFFTNPNPELTQEEIDSKCPRCLGYRFLVHLTGLECCTECGGTGKYQDCDLGL